MVLKANLKPDLDGQRSPLFRQNLLKAKFGGDGGVRTRVHQYSPIGSTCLFSLLD